MRKLFDNLRFRLILLVLLGIIPALVISLLSGLEQRRLAKLRATEDAYRFTRLVSSYQISLAKSTERILSYVSSDTRLLDPQTCVPVLSNLQSVYTIYTRIRMVDANGNIYCTSKEAAEPLNISDQPYFQRAVQERNFTQGLIVNDPVSQKPSLPYAMPILDGDRNVLAVIVASLDMTQILAYVQAMNLPEQSAFLFVDDQGTVMLRYPGTEIYSGENLLNAPIVQEILKGHGEGSAEASGVDGIVRLYAFSPIAAEPDQGFYVSVGIPARIAYAASNRLLAVNLVWIGIAAILAILITWFAGDLLFLRVVSLTAERDLAEKELRETNLQLENRVAQRTAELTTVNERLSQELVERQKMVEILHRHEHDLEKLLRKLEQSNRDLQDFAYIASHDLQEPLRKVQAFSERLVKGYSGKFDEEGESYLQRMSSAANRMQSMINDLLTYSRVVTKQPNFVEVDLNTVVAEVISDLEFRIQDQSGQVLVSNLATLEADPLQMHQLLQNLIGNALKFHRPGVPPVVKVTSEVLPTSSPLEDCRVKIIVEDNGIGFDEKYLDRIFQPFQRLHGRDQYEGSGIGLAVCHRIVERHNGEISATSAPEVGSRFIVILPGKQTKTR